MTVVGYKWNFRMLAAAISVAASPVYAIDLLGPGLGAAFTHIDTQHNASSWAAANLLDDNVSTRWLSNKRDNDLILSFDPGMNERCFGGFSLENYGNNRSVRQFMLLYSNDTSLSADTGSAGWTPVPADLAPTGPINHVHWGQGGRLTAFSRQHNSTSWAAEHINNGSLGDIWLSNVENNTLDFEFDTDWDGNTGDAINVTQVQLHNYGNNRSVELFQVEVSQDGINYTKLEVPGTGPGDADFNYALAYEGGTLDYFSRQHNSSSWAAANIHDGSRSSIWLSNTTINNLDFSFDPEGDGTTGLSGDSGDYFKLEKIALENYGNNRSVEKFQIEVKTAANNNWSKIPVAGSVAGEADFNFALSYEGGIMTAFSRQHNNSSWAAANIHDGSQQTIWLSNLTNNTLDFEFDPDGSGTTGELTDRFTIKKIALENYGNNRSVEKFQVEVKTAANPAWTKLEVPGTAAGDADFNFLSKHEGAALTFIDRQHNTTSWAAANIHDGSQQTIWLSNTTTNTLEFDFDTDLNGVSGDAVNFSKVRLRNYGTSRSVADFEIDVKIGGGAWQAVPAPGGGNTFTAAQASAPQEWNVAAQANVTAFRIRTLTNYGDGYTGIRELEILGTSTGASHSFVAQKPSAEQVFTLDVPDQPVDVTAVRFRTISNYGDGYTGVREFKVLGDSVSRNHTFIAQRPSALQEFNIDPADQPVDVTAIRLQTISNYGDGYTGIREIRFLGDAVTASHTFTAARPSTEQNFVLDADDKATNVIAARLRTIRNYGDGYTGIREFGLLGDPVAPLYIFDADRASTLQNWNFAGVTGKLLRFHTFDNYGDGYTGASEIALDQAMDCYPVPVGAWNMDEPSWGTVTDSSGNNLHGSAYRGANTDDTTPVVSGSPGTCGYGVFDSGARQYVSIPHDDKLNGSSGLTYSIWIHPHSWSGSIRQVMAKSVHGGGSGRAQMGMFSEGGVLKGRAETANGREDIQTTLPTVDQWSHVALVFDGNTLKLYLNGAVASDGSFTTTTLVQNNDPLEIGRRTLSDRYFFDGFMDEARVFDAALTAAEINYVMNQTRPCTIPPDPEQPAFAFNCVEPDADALAGRLYTKVAGQSFDLDVYALKDSDSDNVADAVETDYAASNSRDVTFELVDTSGGEACAARPLLNPSITQTLTYASGDSGFKRTASMSVNKAYRSVGCRIKDENDSPLVIGCSSDSFAVRPVDITLNIPVLDNATDSGDPKAKTGEAFSLEATTIAGYDGTPVIAGNIDAHAGGTAGTLTGSFSAADSSTGTASGSAFTYSEVGNFRFQADAIRDTSFTTVDIAAGDCIDDSYSNSVTGGRVGCDFSNSSATAWVGRFIPDHFTVAVDEVGELANTCTTGSFSYAETNIPFQVYPSVTITAVNQNDTPTVNYTGSYAKLDESNVSMPGITGDNAATGVDGVTPVGLNWNAGSPSWADNGDGTFTFALSGDTFTYLRNSNDLVAPFTPSIQMEISSVTDTDNVQASGMPETFIPETDDNNVSVRYGRLSLANAYGSELQTLAMPMQVEYYNGAGIGFVPNTADDCTIINNVVITDSVADSLAVSETCIWDAAGNSGSFNCATAGSGADQYLVTPVAAGFNLNLKAPGTGNTGVLNITADAPLHLEFDWLGSGKDDPSATATFGIHNTNSNLIYMKEVR